MEVTRKAGDAAKGPAGQFTGEVWLWPRIGATEHTEVRLVLFTPGARSAWHRHPGGQVLHVTEGAGLVRSRGGVREDIRAGDTVTTAPGEWHWHGAAPGAFMVHLAVTDGTTEWAEQVTDDEYQGEPSRLFGCHFYRSCGPVRRKDNSRHLNSPLGVEYPDLIADFPLGKDLGNSSFIFAGAVLNS